MTLPTVPSDRALDAMVHHFISLCPRAVAHQEKRHLLHTTPEIIAEPVTDWNRSIMNPEVALTAVVALASSPCHLLLETMTQASGKHDRGFHNASP